MIEGSRLDPTSMAVVVDGVEYLSHDRFRPRVGALYMLRPALPSDEDEVSMLQCQLSVCDPMSSDIHEDPDEVDFMQNAVESITPSDRTQGQFVVHIFARKTWHKAFDTESTEDLQAQIVDQWNLPTSGDMSVVALHPINYPPHWVADGDTVAFIVELAGDAVHRANVDDVMVVIQVRSQYTRTRAFANRTIALSWSQSKETESHHPLRCGGGRFHPSFSHSAVSNIQLHCPCRNVEPAGRPIHLFCSQD